VVVEHGKPVGIVTERDLLRLMCLGMAEDKPVREVMSSPLLTARFDLIFPQPSC
jgi:CBS domain-containing protein